MPFTPMNKIFGFINEVREELTKVAWPNREQTIRYTALVVIITVAVGVFLGVLDYILTGITAYILGHYGR